MSHFKHKGNAHQMLTLSIVSAFVLSSLAVTTGLLTAELNGDEWHEDEVLKDWEHYEKDWDDWRYDDFHEWEDGEGWDKPHHAPPPDKEWFDQEPKEKFKWQDEHDDHFYTRIDDAISLLNKAIEQTDHDAVPAEVLDDAYYVLDWLEQSANGSEYHLEHAEHKMGRAHELGQKLNRYYGEGDDWEKWNKPHKDEWHDKEWEDKEWENDEWKDDKFEKDWDEDEEMRWKKEFCEQYPAECGMKKFEDKPKHHDKSPEDFHKKMEKHFGDEEGIPVDHVLPKIEKVISHLSEAEKENPDVNTYIEELSSLKEQIASAGVATHEDMEYLRMILEEARDVLHGGMHHQGPRMDHAEERVGNVLEEMSFIFGEVDSFLTALDSQGVSLSSLALTSYDAAKSAFSIAQSSCNSGVEDKQSLIECKTAIQAVFGHLRTMEDIVMAQAELDETLFAIIEAEFDESEHGDGGEGGGEEWDDDYEGGYEDDYYEDDDWDDEEYEDGDWDEYDYEDGDWEEDDYYGDDWEDEDWDDEEWDDEEYEDGDWDEYDYEDDWDDEEWEDDYEGDDGVEEEKEEEE